MKNLRRTADLVLGWGLALILGLVIWEKWVAHPRHSYDVPRLAHSPENRSPKCKEYGCLLLIGQNTYEQTKDDFFYLKIDDSIKGKVGIGI